MGTKSVSNLKTQLKIQKKLHFQRFIYSIGIRHIGIENAKINCDNTKNIKNFIKIYKKKKI